MKYSYYQNKKKPPVGEVTDEEVVNIIRHDEKLAHMTLDIRQHLTANDIATADFIKGELPSVTFSARFIGGRRYDKLIEYNGEIPIDLDKKTPEELARISAAVTRSPFTHISFTRPKGNGYKLTRRHPAAVSRRSTQLPCPRLRPGCGTLRGALPNGHRRIGQRHDTHLLSAP